MADIAVETPFGSAPAASDDRTLVIERVFNAPPDRLFRAWTDPRVLVEWWGPEGYTTPEHQIDMRVGGHWRTVMRSPAGEAHIVSGVYCEITPPNRLVMTWGWEQPDGTRGHETVVEVSLAPTPAGTRLRLVQRLFQNAEQRDRHNMGWTSTFKDLDRFIAR